MSAGFVYFLNADGTNRYKIGLTNDIDRRLKELNGRQAAFPVRLLWSIEVADMQSAEKWLHDQFSDRRVNGEWFQFSNDELSAVQSVYLDAESKFSGYVEPSPSHHVPDFEPEISSFPLGFVACVATVVVGGFFFWISGSQSKSATVLQAANVRKTPNGAIVCVVPRGKKISIAPSDNPNWLKTSDACGSRSGVIYKELVR